MEITATAKYIRISPRKMQILVRGIKSLRPEQAVTQLNFMTKSGAVALQKAVESALDNAKNLHSGSADSLVFKQIEVLPGSAMKRFQAVSRGMAHSYKKRLSHVKVVLTEKQIVNQDRVTVKSQGKPEGENSKSQIPKSKSPPLAESRSQVRQMQINKNPNSK